MQTHMRWAEVAPAVVSTIYMQYCVHRCWAELSIWCVLHGRGLALRRAPLVPAVCTLHKAEYRHTNLYTRDVYDKRRTTTTDCKKVCAE